MAQTTQDCLYSLFGNLYKIISEDQTSKKPLEAALDGIVRELRQESFHRRSETIAEMRGVEQMLGDFNPETSPALAGITRHFGVIPSRPELFSIAQCLRDLDPDNLTPLARMHRRRKMALLKWFDANWTMIEPLLSRIDFD
jgi:hypothetical protein